MIKDALMAKLTRKKKIDFDLDESAMNIFNTKIEDIRMHTETYTEAIVSYCEDKDIEVTDVLPLISNGLKEKMRIEEIKRKNLTVDKTKIMESDIYG